ncbi:hypothetical protein PGT21_032622 [Puccinia graminis f. sp. tritici]|uniref:Uncharacterized protein n=1 Tax=Puccinia graminis f. sp. tritici TaxID=56615 RepID=A0A5B0MIY0_PUCGR|nr:hypothetical protein PGTUg99_033890 [Puccinia graminis f. sp. tritici]KAA1091393.1 hypothetical protein PGT21_032622 [Puccinia graminis f. sp. tritici]
MVDKRSKQTRREETTDITIHTNLSAPSGNTNPPAPSGNTPSTSTPAAPSGNTPSALILMLHHGASFLKLAPSAGRFPEESVQWMRPERPRDALASQHHLDVSKSIQVTLAKEKASNGR